MDDEASAEPPVAARELHVAECWQLIRSVPYGRLAVTAADGPDVFPVNAIVDHGTVVFRTAEGSKLAALTEDARVAFETDGADREAGFAWSVVVRGVAEVVSDRFEFMDAWDLDIEPYAAGTKDWIVRITPDSVSGRWFAIPGSDGVILEPPAQLRPPDDE